MGTFYWGGPRAPDLITVRGQKLLGEADIIILCRFSCQSGTTGI